MTGTASPNHQHSRIAELAEAAGYAVDPNSGRSVRRVVVSFTSRTSRSGALAKCGERVGLQTRLGPCSAKSNRTVPEHLGHTRRPCSARPRRPTPETAGHASTCMVPRRRLTHEEKTTATGQNPPKVTARGPNLLETSIPRMGFGLDVTWMQFENPAHFRTAGTWCKSFLLSW